MMQDDSLMDDDEDNEEWPDNRRSPDFVSQNPLANAIQGLHLVKYFMEIPIKCI